MLVENPLNSSEVAPYILECVHILGWAIGIGSIAIVDFRLLGLGLRHQSPAQLTRDTSWWTLISLSIAIFAGLLLFSTDPDKYYLNVSFVAKMTFLVLAILFTYTIHRKVALSNPPPGKGQLVACISLVLWVSVIFGGIVISFVPDGFDWLTGH